MNYIFGSGNTKHLPIVTLLLLWGVSVTMGYWTHSRVEASFLPLYGECCAKLRRAHMNGFHIDSVWSYYIQAAVTHCYRRSLISVKDVEKLIRILALLKNPHFPHPHCNFLSQKSQISICRMFVQGVKVTPPSCAVMKLSLAMALAAHRASEAEREIH